jgi:AraC-like DNA-binding protein/quercetin dioxygenase-like cupin family protein
MTVAEMPIAEIRATHRATGDGVHLVARNYRKGVRLDPHMHREAQLVYAARGTMQVTTPKGRWLVPPDRAVWVPARLVHAIDVLADIEMRTLYFDLAWLKREKRNAGLTSEFVVRVSPLLHQAILALFDSRNSRERTGLLIKLAMLELQEAEDPATAHDIETLARKVGTSARTLSRLFASETELSFKSWCQRARIAAAIERLSMGKNVSVKKLAADLGYASVPAFSHAFRQVTGKTPTEFVDTK